PAPARRTRDRLPRERRSCAAARARQLGRRATDRRVDAASDCCGEWKDPEAPAQRSARNRTHSCGSVRPPRIPGTRTWGTSWNASISFVAVGGRGGGRRRQREELALNVGAQPVGLRFLRISGTDAVERRE